MANMLGWRSFLAWRRTGKKGNLDGWGFGSPRLHEAEPVTISSLLGFKVWDVGIFGPHFLHFQHFRSWLRGCDAFSIGFKKILMCVYHL